MSSTVQPVLANQLVLSHLWVHLLLLHQEPSSLVHQLLQANHKIIIASSEVAKAMQDMCTQVADSPGTPKSLETDCSPKSAEVYRCFCLR